MDNPDDRKPEPPATDQMDISTESDFANKPGPSEENPNPTDQGPIISSGSSSDDSSPILKKKKKTDLLSDVESAAKKATESPEKEEQHPLLKKRISSAMDNPDDRKGEHSTADQMNISTESDLANKPGPSKEKPNPTDQGHTIASESSTVDSPIIPKKKIKVDPRCDVESAAKSATKSPENKQHQLLQQSSEPKKEKTAEPPSQLITQSLDEERCTPHLQEDLQEKLIELVSEVKEMCRVIEKSFANPEVLPIQSLAPRPSQACPRTDRKKINDNYRAADISHYEVYKTSETQYFELSIHKIPTDKDILQALGYCVTYVNEKCTEDCCRCDIIDCRVCLHKFHCTCEEKHLDTQWCVHLHLAKYAGLEEYKGEAVLFFKPSSTNLTADRHLRAFLHTDKKMWQFESDVFREKCMYLQRSKLYNVKVLESKDSCKCPESKRCIRCLACLCKYICTCPDFWLYRQVCEHVHSVAMIRDERNKEDFFANLRNYGQGIEYKQEDFCSKAIGMLRQHEQGLLLWESMSIIPEDDTAWNIFSSKECYNTAQIPPPYKVTVEQQKTKCICEKPNEDTLWNYCIRCKICPYHYNCSVCTEIDHKGICPHVHMIARSHQLTQEMEEAEMMNEQILEGLLKSFNEILDLKNNKLEEREAVGLVKECMDLPEGAGPSKATTDKSNKASSAEAVKDESKDVPLQEPLDE